MQVERDFKNITTGLALPEGDLNVLTGPNNSGKSAILQYLNIYSSIKGSCDYVSPRRFDISNQVAMALNADQELRDLWNQRKSYNDQMTEFTAPDAIRELLSLPNAARNRIVDWHNAYFGDLRIERSNPDNDFAAPRITIDGRLASQQGSGSRSILAVLCSLMHPHHDTILIDEPEIGIEPLVQKKLAELVKKISLGSDGLPRKRVYLATHSHIFLDKQTLSNNHIVTKDSNGAASIRAVASPEELHTLIFHLLGNSPDDLFFPDNVLIVEGPSDHIFLRRLLEMSGAGGIAVHFADGDGGVGAAMPAIEQMLKTLAYVPWYRDRICVLVDASVSNARLNEWKAYLGDEGERVRRLGLNGIEYYYPRDVLQEITGLEAGSLVGALDGFIEAIRAGGRQATLGSFVGSKRELAQCVIQCVKPEHLGGLDAVLKETIEVLKQKRFSSPESHG